VFTILHLSDLHRSPYEPVDNTSLLASLVNDLDRARAETPPIPAPDAIIVSGDIIQGARLGDPKWASIVRSQYDTAEAFLRELTNVFLGGDRRRLILIPGNHDVCWNTAIAAMEEVVYDPAKQSIRSDLAAHDSLFRWDWSTMKLYKIIDRDRYRQRVDAYWDFVGRFYDGATLSHALEPGRGYQLFELDEGRILVAGFDSIHGNDCFAYGGALFPGAAGGAYLKVRGLARPPALKLAVWHHSVQGPPSAADYMDVNEVHELAGHGFQLGLHGHQHIAAEAAYYVHRAQSQKMAVISAGSLCAGSRELPRGVNRQYNVIVINDERTAARLHVREMIEGQHFAPKRTGAFMEGYVEVNWQPPLDLAGRQVDTDKQAERQAIALAEAALDEGDPTSALSAFSGLRLVAGYGRQLALRAASETAAWDRVLEIAAPPESEMEVVQVVTALERLDRLQEALEILSATPHAPRHIKDALTDRIEIKLRMKR
jgi:3',5'-cyclic AMP phosphodiesterase CpdA